MKTSRGCYDAQLFRRCAGRIVMVSCCCVCPQFFLSALPPRGSINNKHFCNNFQQKQIITLSGIDNVVSCYLSKNHNLQQHEKSKNLQKNFLLLCRQKSEYHTRLKCVSIRVCILYRTEKSEVAIKNTSRKILLKIKFWLVCRYFFLPDISFPLDKSNCSQSG